jgi:hypothetical protein
MLPQHYYVYNEHGDKVIDHILRYENLKEDFDALMEQYKLPVRMPEKSAKTIFHYKRDDKSGAKKMMVNDISPENIQKINEIYSRDFEFFGYPTISVATSREEVSNQLSTAGAGADAPQIVTPQAMTGQMRVDAGIVASLSTEQEGMSTALAFGSPLPAFQSGNMFREAAEAAADGIDGKPVNLFQ